MQTLLPNTVVYVNVVSECDYLVASAEYFSSEYDPYSIKSVVEMFSQEYTKYVNTDPDCDEFDKSAAEQVADCVKQKNYTVCESDDNLVVNIYFLIA